MPSPEESHECDLFLLTSHAPYAASRILPEFARSGCSNVDGWGLGYYVGNEARVVRRKTPAAGGSQVSGEFLASVEVVSSPVILGHLRLASRGDSRVENNHPFRLEFLGYQWLLVHNGTARNHEDLVPRERRLLTDSDNDTPRVFEFLRERIIDYCESRPEHSLIEACRRAFRKLIDVNPRGKFNIILSNGHLTFVCIHWRSFYRLWRPKDTGDVTLISTLARLTLQESWIEVPPPPNSGRAKMLVFGGPSLVLNGSI